MGWAARTTLLSLAIPGGVLLLVMSALLQWNLTPLGTPPLVDFYRYAVLGSGLLLAWRFSSSQSFVALLMLGLANGGLLLAASQGTSGTARNVIGLILPINLLVLAFRRTVGFTATNAVTWGTALFVQSVFVVVLCRPEQGIRLRAFEYPLAPDWIFGWTRLPQPLLLAFVAALILLLAKYVLHHRAIDGALFWVVAAAAMAMRSGNTHGRASAYLATGGLILIVAVVETSYRMAFHDELTGLPGRRAFNQARLALGDQYTVAMVDIDHFKKFNDEFGHDTGDQVLRMVAARLAQISGGGQAFRCGGEEFALLFPGKSVRESYAHAEAVRHNIARATFTVRGPDRSQRERPERRKGTVNRRKGNGGPRQVGVTVSVGLAEPHGRMNVEKVIRAADRALYAAKENGRNRVEIATWGRTTSAVQ